MKNIIPGIIFGVASIVCLIFLTNLDINRYSFEKNKTVVQGTVTAITSENMKEGKIWQTVYFPQVNFQTIDGKNINFKSIYYQLSSTTIPIGSSVKVAYDNRNSNNADIDQPPQNPITTGLVQLILPIFFSLISIIFFRNTKKKNSNNPQ